MKFTIFKDGDNMSGEEESISTIKLSAEMMRLIGHRLSLGHAAKEFESSSDTKLINDFAATLLKSADKLDADKLASKVYDAYLRKEDGKDKD
jgi:predicted kinase